MTQCTVQLLQTRLGRPQPLGIKQDGSTLWSSINRQRVEADELYLTWTGLTGDQPTDTRPKVGSDGAPGQLHGGHDKAVYVYPSEHYAAWETEIGAAQLAGRSFGENWQIEGICEADVHIGDIWQIGEVTLEVSKPRQPCQTLAVYFDLPMIKRMAANGLCGWYLRVITPGVVPTRGTISQLVNRATAPTIADEFARKMRATT